MSSKTTPPVARFRRIGASELASRLQQHPPPLVLDVRRGAAFEEGPGVPTALPLALDRDPILLPDLPRERPVVVYCL